MQTIVSGPIVHRCPYRDELDVGTFELTFDGDAPELHNLGAYLARWVDEKITHEDLARQISSAYSRAVVRLRFRTAGLDVEVVEGPARSYGS